MSRKKGPRSGGPRPRRSFTPAQKLDLLTRYEQALSEGDGGGFLRREGLYSSLVSEWRRAWRESGRQGLRSAGPPGRCRPAPEQVARLLRELRRGPGAHGWDDQRWTLARVAEVTRRLFGISYSLKGISLVPAREGWSFQQPSRRAAGHDGQAAATWRERERVEH